MFTWAELLSTTGRLQLTVSHLLDHLPPSPLWSDQGTQSWSAPAQC